MKAPTAPTAPTALTAPTATILLYKLYRIVATSRLVVFILYLLFSILIPSPSPQQFNLGWVCQYDPPHVWFQIVDAHMFGSRLWTHTCLVPDWTRNYAVVRLVPDWMHTHVWFQIVDVYMFGSRLDAHPPQTLQDCCNFKVSCLYPLFIVLYINTLPIPPAVQFRLGLSI